jgi:hypothetical protein
LSGVMPRDISAVVVNMAEQVYNKANMPVENI